MILGIVISTTGKTARALTPWLCALLGCTGTVHGGDASNMDARVGGQDAGQTADASAPDGGIGEDAALVRTPADCGSLPPPGTWERISPIPDGPYWETPNGFAPQTGMVVVRPDNGAVYVALTHEGVYRSANCGAAWEKINADPEMETGAIWSWLVDPVDPDIMYVVRGYGTNAWMTWDGGVHWSRFVPDSIAGRFTFGAVNILSMDPTDRHHLLIGPHGSCEGTPAACLAETFDAGMRDPVTGEPIEPTWRLFEAPAWTEGGGQMMLSRTHWLFGSDTTLQITVNGGMTWDDRPSVPSGTSYFSQRAYRSPSGTHLIGHAYGLLRSDDGVAWESIGSGGPTGRIVTFASDDRYVFAGSPTQRSLWQASTSDISTWNEIPLPEEPSAGDAIIYLAYDSDNRVVYASRFGNGLWRYIVE